MIRTIFFIVFLTMTASDLAAQVSFAPLDGLAQSLRDDVMPGDTASISAILFERTQEFALYSLGAPVYTGLVEENRLDKQVGGSSANTGSTSLVSHGSVPSLLGFAVESGALYQSVSNNVVTFRLNPSGLARALANNRYLASGPPLDAAALEQGLSRISLSASFDFQQGTTPGTFTGERSQLQEAALRVDILNKRDPRHPSHAAEMQKLRAELGKTIVPTMSTYVDLLKKAPGYEEWRAATAKKLAAIKFDDDKVLQTALFEAADEFTATFGSVPELQKVASNIVGDIKAYRSVRDEVDRNIAKSSVLTFEYAFNTLSVPAAALAGLPPGTQFPDISTARLIFSSPLGTVGEATVNGSATFFNSTRPGMQGNFRDFQVSASMDFRLPELQGIGKPVLTFAALGVFLKQQPFGIKVAIQNIETSDGAIGVFQSKLTFPVGPSGLQVPLSFTIANRSEFNTEKEVRGSIGMTFDLDKLFSR